MTADFSLEQQQALAMAAARQRMTAQPADPSAAGSGVGAGLLSGAEQGIQGFGQFAHRAGANLTSLGGLFPNPVSQAYDQLAKNDDQVEQQLSDSRSQARAAAGKTGYDFPKLGGEILSPGNLPMVMAGGELPEAGTLAEKLIQGGAMGAAGAVSQPVDTRNGSYSGQKIAQALMGGAGGVALPAAGSALGAAISPTINPAVQSLLNEGIRVPMGLSKGLQDKASSFIPTIQGAQARSLQDLNNAVANRALNPIGKSLPEGMAGRDAVSYVKNTLGDAYNTLLPKLQGQADPQFQQEIGNLKNMVGSLPKQEQGTFQNVMDRELNSRISPNGSISGQSLKDIESGINTEKKNYTGVTDAYQRQLGNAFGEVQNSLRGMIARTNPDYADELQNINKGYSNYAVMRKAASSLGADQGTFTPAQLANAIKGNDNTVGKGAYATGQANMQDLSDAAKSVLPSKYPDSGTAGRVALGYLAGGGLPAVMSHPIAAAAGTATMGLYSRPGQALARLLMTERPDVAQPIGNAVSKYSNPAALAKLLMQRSTP